MTALVAPSPPLRMTAQDGIPLGQFMRHYAAQPFELIDGEMIPMSPQAARSSRKEGRLYRLLADFIEKDGRGEVFIETPFVLSSQKDWVKGSRTPDLMLVDAPRLAALEAESPGWDEGPLPIVPNIAIEVLSPTDKLKAAQEKARQYLADGVAEVWLIDPWRGALYVYQPGKMARLLTEEETLHGEGLLAGLELPLLSLLSQ